MRLAGVFAWRKAQDRDLAIDGQACALVVVSHHAIAQHDPFVGLEFDFQGHV